jgi:hypothetical protein
MTLDQFTRYQHCLASYALGINAYDQMVLHRYSCPMDTSLLGNLLTGSFSLNVPMLGRGMLNRCVDLTAD